MYPAKTWCTEEDNILDEEPPDTCLLLSQQDSPVITELDDGKEKKANGAYQELFIRC